MASDGGNNSGGAALGRRASAREALASCASAEATAVGRDAGGRACRCGGGNRVRWRGRGRRVGSRPGRATVRRRWLRGLSGTRDPPGRSE